MGHYYLRGHRSIGFSRSQHAKPLAVDSVTDILSTPDGLALITVFVKRQPFAAETCRGPDSTVRRRRVLTFSEAA